MKSKLPELERYLAGQFTRLNREMPEEFQEKHEALERMARRLQGLARIVRGKPMAGDTWHVRELGELLLHQGVLLENASNLASDQRFAFWLKDCAYEIERICNGRDSRQDVIQLGHKAETLH